MLAATMLVFGVVEVSPAAAASPWWSLTSSVRPAVLKPGGEGVVSYRALDIGDASVTPCTPVASGSGNFSNSSCSEAAVPSGSGEFERTPVVLTMKLPPGLAVKPVSAENPGPNATLNKFPETNFGPSFCTEPAPREVRCSYEWFFGPLLPFEYVEVQIAVEVTGAAGGESSFEVTGGDAEPASLERGINVGEEAPSFGVEESGFSVRPEEAGGGLDTRAGSHPFQLTTNFALNQNAETPSPPALPRNLAFELPAGLLANINAVPRCSELDFLTKGTGGGFDNRCSGQAAIGVSDLNLFQPALATAPVQTYPVPVFNLVPSPGEPARFGFYFNGIPVTIDFSLRSDGDYGATARVANITQISNLISTSLTIWGTPSDPSHDSSRGWGCLANGFYRSGAGPACVPSGQNKPVPLLQLPTSCETPFTASVEGSAWPTKAFPAGELLAPTRFFLQEGEGPITLDACDRVPFDPMIGAEPSTDATTTGTGLGVDIDFDDEGLANPSGLVQSQIRKAVVSLPPGFTANPSVAEGLGACPQSAYENASLDGSVTCPEDSKIGEVEVESPLLEAGQKLTGALYVAKQRENTNGNLLTIYLIAANAKLGVIVRQALKVIPDPVTGQLTTEVENIPQLPFSHLHIQFRQGQRAPLITPPTCGPYAVKAQLYPWSNPGSAVERESSFQITQGPEGQGCPSGGVPPFDPTLEAGTQNNAAGSFSPFYTRISRKDSEQEITHFSIKLPPGLSGKLAGVAKCSDSQIAAAKAREHELGGQEELEHPSCPSNSEVGHTLVGTGVGNVLAYAPGKLYLAGPYKGSQISIVSITAAKVGPFDLGTVVIREGLKVNPETAQVSVDAAGSDPIPHIVDGIPVHLRDIRIYVNRPNFTINPTSCAKMSTAATVLGSGLNFASEADDQPVTVTSPFQAADCASLGFKPKLSLKLKGKTRRGGLPKLTAVVSYPKQGDYANIRKTVVTLPPSEFLEQGHIGSSCTRVQFNAGGGNGEQCPKKSILGHAKAITPLLDEPVEGLVYLRSNGGERKLPDLVAALHSEDININLVGFISSKHKKGSEVSQIRNTFAAVPDAPVSKFTLELFGGKKGLLVNSTNICKGKHRAISDFTGQNGKLYDTKPVVKAQCGRRHKKHAKKHKTHGNKSGGKRK